MVERALDDNREVVSSGQRREPLEQEEHRGVSRWLDAVFHGDASAERLLVAAAREKPRPRGIRKSRRSLGDERQRSLEVSWIVRGFEQVEEPGGEKRVVVENGGFACVTAAGRSSELSARATIEPQHGGSGLLGSVEEAPLAGDTITLRERADGEPVPRRHHLRIERRLCAPHASGEELRAPRRPALDIRGALDARAAERRHAGTLEVPGLRHAEKSRSVAVLVAHRGAHLGRREEIGGSLFPVRVGVEARPEAALGCAHVPQEEIERVEPDGSIPGVVERCGRGEVEGRELCVVVEHLLEMRDRPCRLGGVAEEAAADVIVDAAGRDRVDCLADCGAELRIAPFPERVQQKPPPDGRRELCPPSKATVYVVERRQGASSELVELVDAECAALAGRLRRGDAPRDLRAAVLRVARSSPESFLDCVDHLQEPLVRKVRPGEEGMKRRGEERRHGPAAAARYRLHGLHVHRVEVGAFLAIDLDRDEVLVEERGHVVLLEHVLRHDVAPVARHVADGEEDGPTEPRGERERFRPPRAPVDRVVGVLEQIGRGRTDEVVSFAAYLLDGARGRLPERRCARRRWPSGCRRAAPQRQHEGEERRDCDAKQAVTIPCERGTGSPFLPSRASRATGRPRRTSAVILRSP